MSVNVNVPFQVTIAADGSVTIQRVASQLYTLTEANATFEGYLRNDILHAFKVGYNSGNPNTALSVEMDDSKMSAFVTELATQIQEASMDNSGNSSAVPTLANIKNLEAYLLEWANKNLIEELEKNGIAQALEADALPNLAHTHFKTDASGGAQAMYDGLDAMDPKRLAVVASQIPNSKWMSAFNGVGERGMATAGAQIASCLPLEDGGDSMTFQFIITQNFAVSEASAVSASMMGGPDTSTSGIEASAEPIGQYSVPTRIINLKLTRPSPSEYDALKSESYTEPTAFDTGVGVDWDVDAKAADVLTKQNTYNNSITPADNAYTTWKNANDKHVARVKADTEALNASNAYTAALAAQTAALVAADKDTSGPLYDAAQRAIVATNAALTRKGTAETAQTVAVAADLNEVAATAKSALDGLLADSKDASALVTSSFKALSSAQNAYALAQVKLAQAIEFWKFQVARKAAAQESANRAANVALLQWTDASANAVAAVGALPALRSSRNAADMASRAAVTAESDAEAAYVTDKSLTAANILKEAQKVKNETAAVLHLEVDKFEAQLAVAKAAVIAANIALGVHDTAAGHSDVALAAGFVTANTFDTPDDYVYVP